MIRETTNEPEAPRARRARRSLSVILGTTALASGLVLLALGAPCCPTAGFWGVPCPGCGLTRATLALLHGEIHTAFVLHPLVFAVLPTYGGALAFSLSSARGKTWSPAYVRTLGWCGGAVVALMTLVWLARFAGYLGGPVSVTTYAEWARSLGE